MHLLRALDDLYGAFMTSRVCFSLVQTKSQHGKRRVL